MPSRNLADLDPVLQSLCKEFLAQCASAGIKANVDCTYRSNAEQDADYAQGRVTPGGIITNAKAGQSAHNCMAADGTPAAKAFDIYITNDDGTLNWDTTSLPWETAGQIGQGLGLVWGGAWEGNLVDYPHFELVNWKY